MLPEGAGAGVGAVACMYTMTPDGHFVIGAHPEHPEVILGCGFSGHGFKFVPVLGEVLADLALGATPAYDLALFSPGRLGAPVPQPEGAAACGRSR